MEALEFLYILIICNKYYFTSSNLSSFYFPFLVWLLWLWSEIIMLDSMAYSGHLYFRLDLKEQYSKFWVLCVKLVEGFSYMIFIMVR